MRTPLVALGLPLVAAVLLFASGTSVLAQESATVHVKQASLSGHSCDANEWHFIINQLSEGQAPASITVMWAGGVTATVALSQTSGPVGHYATTANLGIAVTDATATIVGPWSGQFVLSHGPCFGTTQTQTTQGTATTTTTTQTQTQTGTQAQTAATAQGQGPIAVAGVQTAPQAGVAAGIQTAPEARNVAGQQAAAQRPQVSSLPSTSTKDDAILGPFLMSLALLAMSAAVRWRVSTS